MKGMYIKNIRDNFKSIHFIETISQQRFQSEI